MKNLSIMSEPPEGIIVTIGARMYEASGYKAWLRDFLDAMHRSTIHDTWAYWLRQGNEPKIQDSLRYVYLCIGNRIRYRVFYAGSMPEMTMKFEQRNGRTKTIHGKAWILVAGPVERAPFKIEKIGFQGFRYCDKLF